MAKKNYDYVAQVQLKHNQLPATFNVETQEITVIQPKDNHANLVVINYTNYCMINSTLLERLVQSEDITRVERGYILEMSTMLKTEYNALFQKNNTPHSITTLSKAFDVSYNKLSTMLKRFVNAGIIYKIVGKDKEIFVMNPFLARKRKFISAEVAEIFTSFNEEIITE